MKCRFCNTYGIYYSYVNGELICFEMKEIGKHNWKDTTHTCKPSDIKRAGEKLI